MSLSGGKLAGGNSSSQKSEFDFYATDPSTVNIFMDYIGDEILNNCNTVLEPAVGMGHLLGVLSERHPNKLYTTMDIHDYNGLDEDIIGDFLTHDFGEEKFDCVITNPPFSELNGFIERSLEVSNRYVVLFAKIQLLEGVSRKYIIQNSPLKNVIVHSSRQATWKNGDPRDRNGKKWATTMMMAWYVWDKKYKGEPILSVV